MLTKLRIFLDTSAILAGLNSPSGAAGVILAACFADEFTPVISPLIIEEAGRNIPAKFPALANAWATFLLLPPDITPEPNINDIRTAFQILPTSDAAILAAAIKARPDVLITWNTRDFMREKVKTVVDFPIVTPGDFINNIWLRELKSNNDNSS